MKALTSRRAADALKSLWRETLAALSGRTLVRESLRRMPIPALHVRVFALGKAAAAMAFGASEALRAQHSGLVVSHERIAVPRGFTLMVGGHPIPNDASAAAGEALLRAVDEARPEEMSLFLLSGGGSSLASLPADGLTHGDVARTTDALLKSGASISEVNAVRKHITQLGGGRLAARCRSGRIAALMLSDIPSGDLSALASGPVMPDPTTFADALEVVSRLPAGQIPAQVIVHLTQGAAGKLEETPKPGERRLLRIRHHVLADPAALASAAMDRAAKSGMSARVAASSFQGNLQALTDLMCGAVREELSAAGNAGPVVLIAVGEPSLDVPEKCGEGGRMQTLALRLALELAGLDVAILCAGSDGRDGPTDLAGAVADGTTAALASAMGENVPEALDRFDASPCLRRLGLGLPAFASGTNLTDMVLVCCRASALDKAQ